MDYSIYDTNDFWYRDIDWSLEEQEGYKKFLHKLANGVHSHLTIKNNFNLDIDNSQALDYWDRYNIFVFQNEQMYNLLQHIKGMMLKACDKLQINYDEQKYHIHGWVDQYNGEFNNTDLNNIVWREEATIPNVFSGMLVLNGEPSINHYIKNGQYSSVENMNARLYLFTNYKHFHGEWKEDSTKVVFGFTIYPISALPDEESMVVRCIPL